MGKRKPPRFPKPRTHTAYKVKKQRRKDTTLLPGAIGRTYVAATRGGVIRYAGAGLSGPWPGSKIEIMPDAKPKRSALGSRHAVKLRKRKTRARKGAAWAGPLRSALFGRR